MVEPRIAQSEPYEVELEPGTYWWCACGRSTDQPFCDGSHKGSGITPIKFQIETRTRVWLCGCKHTDDQPFCDGSHKNL